MSWGSSSGARPEGIATPESGLQVRVLPGVLELAVQWRSEARRDRDAVADAATLTPLPGSPKRKLREYASLHRKPLHIPSTRASGFKEREEDNHFPVDFNCPENVVPSEDREAGRRWDV